MSTTRLSLDVDAPPAAVFDLIHDYPRRLTWDPFLRSASLLRGATEAGKGVRARCVARWRSGGLGMDVVYLSFDRPRVAAIEMVRGPWVLRSFHASLKQVALDGGSRTRVTYAYHFAVRPAALGPVLRPIFDRVFAAETRGRLRALRDHFAAASRTAASAAA